MGGSRSLMALLQQSSRWLKIKRFWEATQLLCVFIMLSCICLYWIIQVDLYASCSLSRCVLSLIFSFYKSLDIEDTVWFWVGGGRHIHVWNLCFENLCLSFWKFWSKFLQKYLSMIPKCLFRVSFCYLNYKEMIFRVNFWAHAKLCGKIVVNIFGWQKLIS